MTQRNGKLALRASTSFLRRFLRSLGLSVSRSPVVHESLVRVCAQVFTSVFTTECVIKLGALGIDFFRNGWNVFDFVIVLASLVDLGLEIVNGLSVLRGMRLVSTAARHASCFVRS